MIKDEFTNLKISKAAKYERRKRKKLGLPVRINDEMKDFDKEWKRKHTFKL